MEVRRKEVKKKKSLYGEESSGTNTESGSYTNSESESESVRSLKDIVLTEDITCKCPHRSYTNAEVNSPRMGKTHKIFYEIFRR